ncbi:OmpA family protein [Flavobacterium sp.]|uniref:OmpA family protein n=1 Tax=Flavobacterium sp. TaxID=239 RepID=UPI003D0D7884
MKNFVYSVSLLLISITLYSQDKFMTDDNNSSIEKKTFLELNDRFQVDHTGINTNLSEIGATFFRNKYIMYSSRKTGAIGAGKDNSTNQPYNGLYCISIDNKGNLSHPYFFASALNEDGNEGGIAFSPDQKTVYFTNSRPENPKNYQIYKATFDENCNCKNMWQNKELLDLSSNDYSIENPCISTDGSKIYFASNMPGGYGGYDIYVADINNEGKLFNIQNLGREINTPNDENFPFVAPHKELYFSSKGHDGYGGFDVFISRIYKKHYSTPINLGKTINTNSDEVAFILANKNRGYLTSNRANSLGSNDIYQFSLQKSIYKLNGQTVEKTSKIALPNTKIALKNSDGELVNELQTDDLGNFNFETSPLENYTLEILKEGYQPLSLPITTTNENHFSKIELDQLKAIVTPTKIVIENIYFDLNKSSLKTESTLSLNKIVQVLNANPEMQITINAHTDSKGNDLYNLQLSEKRAKSTVSYLIQKGIAPNRLTLKGYGETQLLSNCKINCTEADYQKDRRVEFIINP